MHDCNDLQQVLNCGRKKKAEGIFKFLSVIQNFRDYS